MILFYRALKLWAWSPEPESSADAFALAWQSRQSEGQKWSTDAWICALNTKVSFILLKSKFVLYQWNWRHRLRHTGNISAPLVSLLACLTSCAGADWSLAGTIFRRNIMILSWSYHWTITLPWPLWPSFWDPKTWSTPDHLCISTNHLSEMFHCFT